MKKCTDNKSHDFLILHAGYYRYEDKGNYVQRTYGKNYEEYLGCKRCGYISRPTRKNER